MGRFVTSGFSRFRTMSELQDALDLWDYRRRVGELYREVRLAGEDEKAWRTWRNGRDELFGFHPQTALDPDDLEGFEGLSYFGYDPTWRFQATVEPAEGEELAIGHSADGFTSFRRFGRLELDSPAGDIELFVYWLDSYGGGVFLPFRDETSGDETYGGGRYLLDTAKGADLGHNVDSLVLDFNYAYHPSCVYSYRWSCPLAPPENHLKVAVRAGERL